MCVFGTPCGEYMDIKQNKILDISRIWEIFMGIEENLKEDPKSRLAKGSQQLQPAIKNHEIGMKG